MRGFKLKAVLLFAMLVMCSGISFAQKTFEWVKPSKLSGNEIVDDYLLSCDTLWNKIQSYNEQITYYKVAQAPTDEVDETGNPIYSYMVIDDEGNARNTWQVIKQYADWITSGALIGLQCTAVSAQTVSATAEMPKLGLKAISYAKHLQAGPKIVAMGVSEIKEMNASFKVQASAIKKLKSASTNTAENKHVVIKTSDIPEGVELVQMTSEELDQKAASVIDENIKEDDIDWDKLLG